MFSKVKSFFLRNQTLRQTVVKNAFWLTVSNLGGRLIRAIIIVYAARVLGAGGWGAFSFAISLAAFLSLFTELGLNSIVARETAKTAGTSSQKNIFSTAFFIKFAMIFLAATFITFIGPKIATIEDAKKIMPLAALIVIFDGLREFGFSFFRGLEKMEREASLFLTTNLAIVGLGFLFLYISPTVSSFAYAYVVGTGLGAALTIFTLRDYLRGMFGNFRKEMIKPIIAAAWPFTISGLLGFLLTNTDILILGWLRSASEVGVYAAAVRIIQLLYLIPSVLMVAILPIFSRLAKRDNQKFRLIFEKIVSFTLLTALPIAVGGFILGRQMMVFLFGATYLAGALAFQILVLTILIDFPSSILSSSIFAYDRQKNLIISSALGGSANVVLDFILIPHFGTPGSAVATFLSALLSNWYLWRTMKKINYFEILPYLKKSAVAAVLMAGVIILLAMLNLNVIIIIAAGALTYFGALFYLKEKLLKEINLTFRSLLANPKSAAEMPNI